MTGKRLSACLAFLLLVLAMVAGRAAASGVEDGEIAVEVGRESLREGPGYDWYDEAADDVRPLNVRVEEQVSRPTNNRSNINSSTVSGVGDFLSGLLKIVGWTLFVVLLALLLYFIFRAFLDEETKGGQTVRVEEVSPAADIDRLEALPFQIDTAQGDLLGRARELYQQGKYAEAIIYLFSYQLIQLDKHQLIRLTKGKTNRQYLYEARRRSNASQFLERTMIAFEDVFFGNHSLTKDRFESCWRDLDEFEKEMNHAVA